MTLIVAENTSKRFKDQVLLDDVSFTITAEDRIGLVGKNGIGKTTLLELLSRIQEVDAGTITHSRSLRLDYVQQDKTEVLDQTLFDYVAAARQDLLDMGQEIKHLESHLEDRPDDTESLTLLGSIQQEYEVQGGFNLDNELKVILAGLGFPIERHKDRLRNFSGGEKNRAGLARLLAGNGNLLLLDEPTNHLDIESTKWLEEYLRKLGKAYIVVSHDRAFLTVTVDRVWELAFGKIDTYTGGYSNYLKQRVERKRLAAHHYRHQQEEIKRIEEFIRRNMAGQKTKQAQSKLKYLNRIKRLEAPRSDGQGPAIKMESSGRSFHHVMAIDEASFGYGSATVVGDVSFDLYRGDKVGLIGRNGSGKSTILKSLIGELGPVNGSVKLGNNIEVAYFDQDLSDLTLNGTVLDNIWELDPTAEVGHMRSFLARFGFTGEDPFKLVAALSGGEKTKLCLARLLYHPANLIILDEPTNHLDVYAREALEEALIEYDGSCLIVSHDRYFLDRVVDRIVHISDGQAAVYAGNYSRFAELTAVPEVIRKGTPDDQKAEQKREYLEFKERSRQASRLKKAIASTRELIEQLEAEHLVIESETEPSVSPDDWQKLQEVAEQKRDLETRILQAYVKLEELEGTELD